MTMQEIKNGIGEITDINNLYDLRDFINGVIEVMEEEIEDEGCC